MKKCSVEQFRSLSDKLRILREMDWKEIDTAPREKNGYELIPTTQIRGSMPAAFVEEKDVYVFRFGGKKGRVAGIKDAGSNFYVLFVDHDFTLYDHG